MPVTYYYWRYFKEYSEQIATLPEALARAKDDVERNTANPDRIVLDHDEILEQSGYYSDIDISGPIIDGTAIVTEAQEATEKDAWQAYKRIEPRYSRTNRMLADS